MVKDEKKSQGDLTKTKQFRKLPLLCEKSGAIAAMLVGVTVGRQSNKILVDSKMFKILY